MSKFNRAQPVTDADDLIVETMPPSIAQPVTLRWRSSNSGHVVKSYLETTYRTDTARDEAQQSDAE